MKLKQLQKKINQERFDQKGLEVVLEIDGTEVTLADVQLEADQKIVRLVGGAEIATRTDDDVIC